MAENYETLTQKTDDLIRRMPAGTYLDHNVISLTHKVLGMIFPAHLQADALLAYLGKEVLSANFCMRCLQK